MVGILLAHLGDLLFAGATSFTILVLKASRAFRTGELATLSVRATTNFALLVIEKRESKTVFIATSLYPGISADEY